MYCTEKTSYSLIDFITDFKTEEVFNKAVYKRNFHRLFRLDVVAALHEVDLGYQNLRDIFSCKIKFLSPCHFK